LSLKAVVFDKEQKRNFDDKNAGSRKMRRRERSDLGVSRRKRDPSDPGRSNRGVEARNRLDEEDLDNREPHVRSAEAMKRKAELYERLASGTGGVVQDGCMVDFSRKPQDVVESSLVDGSKGSNRNVGDKNRNEGQRVEQVVEDYVNDLAQESANSAWAWGTGRKEAPRRKPIQKNNQNSDGPSILKVSQWDKTLNSKEKEYLKEIKEETKEGRLALEQRKRKREEKRALLRSKQQERLLKMKKTSSATAELDSEVASSSTTQGKVVLKFH